MRTHSTYRAFLPMIALLTVFRFNQAEAADLFPIATTSEKEFGFGAAFDGSNYLVALQVGSFTNGTIASQLVSQSGERVGGRIPTGESGAFPHVAFDGTNYLMVWAGSAANPGFRGQLFSKAGSPVGPALSIHPVTPRATSLAYGAGKYLVCWSDETSIWGQFVERDGTLSGTSFKISGAVQPARENAAAFDGTNFFVVFNGGYDNLPNIYGQRVSPTDGLRGGTVLVDANTDPSDNPVAVAFDGHNYFVVFNDEVGGLGTGAWRVVGRLVSRDGVVQPGRFPIGASEVPQHWPFLAFDGTQYLVSWTGGVSLTNLNVVLRFVSQTGQPVGPEFSPIPAQGTNQPMIAGPLFDGTKYLLLATLASFTNEWPDSNPDPVSADVFGAFISPMANQYGCFTYATDGSTVTITGYACDPAGDVTIPDTIKGLPVTSIGDWAFASCTSLASIMIPDSVTNIGAYAFYDCTTLTNATIPASATNIGGWAFASCTSLASIAVPYGVTSIAEYAFYRCFALTSVSIGDSVTSIGDSAFYICYSLASITIPTNLTSIGDYAFFQTGLTNVTIPASVTNIGAWAFSSCNSLTSIAIPKNVTSIGYCALSLCASLTEITVDPLNNFYSSADGVLFDKNRTILFQCPQTKSGSYLVPNTVTNIGDRAFVYCTSLTNVTLGNNVDSIEMYAFASCSSLASVTIPSSVTRIGYRAFSYCSALTEISLPGSVSSLGDGVFSSCSALAAISVAPSNSFYCSVDGILFNKSRTTLLQYPPAKPGSHFTLPNAVTTIAGSAFSSCANLTSVTIPDSVTSMGDYAFSDCTSLTNVTISNNLIFIPWCAFAFCSSLTSVTIPNSVTSIASGAFDWCSSLATVTIGTNVTSIGQEAFSNCGSLTSVTIPSSVTSIGGYAFAGCTTLTGVYFQGNAPSFGPYVFLNAPNPTVYYLPGTTGWGPTFGGRPTALWLPQIQTRDASFGVRTNQFGFNITWAPGMVVVVEACTNLTNPGWSPVSTNILTSDYSYFSDPEWTNYASRFYRLRWLMPEALDYIYTTNNGTITITGYTGSGGAVTIPSMITGLPVTGIGAWAFASCYGLSSVTIPDSVTSIGDAGFYSCSSLTNISIGSNVASIGKWALASCTALTAITVDVLNPFYSSLNGVLFSENQDALIQCPGGKEGWYAVPDSVTSIGDNAFYGCSSLTNITIPDTVTSIGAGAFFDCSTLTDLTIPSTVTSIGDGAFSVCTSLTSVTIPGSITTIPSFAFQYCTSLTNVTIPGSVTNIKWGAFLACSSLPRITIPRSVTMIELRAFAACTALTAITVELLNPFYCSVDGVLFNKPPTTLVQFPGGKSANYAVPMITTAIGDYAFDNVINLTSLTIPSSVTNLGNLAFIWCPNLTGVYFGGNAPGIGSYVFDGANNATVYHLPGTLGWGTTFGGRPTALWLPQVQTSDASFGVRTNQFGFNITWASGMVVVVEACTNLVNPTWSPLSTNTLTSDYSYFSDPEWTNYASRFYRLRAQ